MALRIGKKAPIGPPPIAEDISAVEDSEALPEDLAAAVTEEEPLAEEPTEELPVEPTTGAVSQYTAGYKGPEEGPFNCGNCVFFTDGTCKIVDGEIDPEGVCNLFTTMSGAEMPAGPEEDIPEPEDEPLPEAPPEEV